LGRCHIQATAIVVSYSMVGGILTLLGFQLIGEALHRFGRLPLPGPVIGMFLLMIFLLSKPLALSQSLDSTSRYLFDCFGLLFVPAGVGVITNWDVLRTQWVPILVGLIGSTLVSLLATAYVMHKVSRSKRDRLPGDPL
jgi:holin-like protein